MKTITLTQSSTTPQGLSALVGGVVEMVEIMVGAGVSVHLVDDLLKAGMSECRLYVTVEQGGSCVLDMKFMCPKLLRCDGCPHQLPSRCPKIVRSVVTEHRGDGATTQVHVRFAGTQGRVLHIETEQRHHASNTHSALSIQSVLADGAALTCTTLVSVDKNLVGVTAHQENRNLLLGNRVIAKITPKLEIQSNGVTCSHSSATGHAKPQDLWYCATRGINHDQTMRLLTSAFLQ